MKTRIINCAGIFLCVSTYGIITLLVADFLDGLFGVSEARDAVLIAAMRLVSYR